MEKKTFYGILSGVLWGFITSLLSGFFGVGVLVAPGLLAIVGVRAGRIGFLLAESGYLLGTLLILGSPGLAVFAQCSIPAIALMYFSKRIGRFETLALTSGGALAGSWVGLNILTLLTGTDQISAAYARPLEAVRSLREFLESQLKLFPDYAASAQQFKANFDYFESIAAHATPAIYIGVAMATGLIAVLLVSRSVRRSGKAGFILPPFSGWFLPRSFTLMISALLILAIVGSAQGWSNFDTVLICVQVIFITAYSISGLSMIDTLLLRAKAGKALRYGTAGALSILSVVYIPVLLLAGLFDGLFGIRRRLNKPANPSV